MARGLGPCANGTNGRDPPGDVAISFEVFSAWFSKQDTSTVANVMDGIERGNTFGAGGVTRALSADGEAEAIIIRLRQALDGSVTSQPGAYCRSKTALTVRSPGAGCVRVLCR
jgi:hypothetical protein